MNQMFVIDIYLNKFKNHFCSINPRFFRYFACGLNGYVGMIDFNSHQWIKYGFVAFAVAIALASLLFSNKLVRELTIEERNKIEIWAKATEHLATETDNSDMNLVLRILQGNTTIPVILYDKSNRSFIVNNIKLPDSAGSKVKYNATIEMSKGYVSGVCIMANDGSVIKGSLFNEFGISTIDFTYQPDKKKVKLLSVIKILNKWYIKKVLRKDLVQVMENLSKGIYSYHDKKFKIDYNFSLLKDATEE